MGHGSSEERGTEGFETGTDDYHTGTEGYRADTEGYRSGTEGYGWGSEAYRTGTEGYPADTEKNSSAAGCLAREVPDAQRGGDARSEGEAELPWWKRYGCDQYEPFWEDVRNGVIQIETDDPRAQPGSRAPEVLDGDEDAGWLPRESDRPPRRPRVADSPDRQVNVKLRRADFETLQMVAADYGVATSTMARMLLRRGIRAAGPDRR
jgi:hypothetical protein